ncbi:hypothetical protein OOJ91_34005 [Micromonospora lupini]|uniref:hypothetical protein n=1 Tax=Micromonospora lupini TaxID=285679 RepID=UPI0022533BF6|nr:hypothetical protein [Micromonospora lupini]MCX5070863.1 hypothetical protein [Micromonospora lupini]
MQKITTPDAILTAVCGQCAEQARQLDYPAEGKVRGPVCPTHASGRALVLTPATVDTELYYADFTAGGIRAALDDERLVDDHPRFAEQLNAQLARMAPLEAIYEAHRWQRWYAVAGGHVHTSRACSSCYPTTLWGWHFTLSGADHAAAVTEEGWRICTICVPGAPTLPAFNGPGRRAQAQADAAGKCLSRTPVDVRWVASPYGRCPDCTATHVPVNRRSGLMRKHTHAAHAAERMRVARLTDPKLIGGPDGSELRVDHQLIPTVRVAEAAYVDHLWWAANPQVLPDNRDRHVRLALQLAEALAAKRNVTVEEVIESMVRRVKRNLAQ